MNLENIPIIEDNIRVDVAPAITIGDKPLFQCTDSEIKRAILALINRIQEQRKRIEDLEERVYGTP